MLFFGLKSHDSIKPVFADIAKTRTSLHSQQIAFGALRVAQGVLSREIAGVRAEVKRKVFVPEEFEQRLVRIESTLDQFGAVLSGNIHLVLDRETEEVSAAILNQEAMVVQREFTCTLSSIDGDRISRHEWASFKPEVRAEGMDISHQGFQQGILTVMVTFPARQYQAGESLTVTIAVSPDNEWLGFPIASVKKTFNVTA